MKKVLLLCLTALMCCVTGAWAITGSGTESDPYVVQSGDTYTIPASTTVYISFTPTEDGTLNLAQSGWSMLGWMVKGPNNADYGQYVGMQENYGDVKNTDFPSMQGGETYLIKNNGSAYSDETITVTFTSNAADPNYFGVASAEPAEGSTLTTMSDGDVISITLDNPVTYLRARIDGSVNGYVTEVEAVPVGEGTPVLDDEGNPVVFVDQTDPENTYELKEYTQWTIGPSDAGDGTWTFYQGETYTVTLLSYEDKNAWYNMTPSFQTTLTYVGGTEAEKFSDIKVVNVTPDPDETDVTKMLSSENHVVTVTFSGVVDEVDAHINLGYGATNPVNNITTEVVDGQTVATIDVPVFSTDYEIMLALHATENGMELNDEDPVYPGTFQEGWYTFAMPVADGRKALMELTYENLTPTDGAFVDKLDKLTFTVGETTDDALGSTSKAKAYVLNAENDTVADILLTYDGFNVTAQVCERGTVDNFEGTGTPAAITEPGKYTVVIDSISMGDGNFDEDYPWLAGYSGVGHTNPTWRWTYNVVDELASVESIDPAPYEVGGEWSEEIPAQVRITLSTSDIDTETITTIATYGGNQREFLETTVENGNELVIKLTETVRAQSRVSLITNVTTTAGQPIAYNVPDGEAQAIYMVYQLDRATMEVAEVDPADRSTVESLSTIGITMSEEVGNLNYDNTVTLVDANGTDYSCAIDYDWDNMAKVVVTLDDEITADGTYTLTIPEKTIFSMNADFGYVDQYGNPEGDFYNSEMTFVFYIGQGTGISAIKTDADGNVKVYTIDGVYVGTGKAADMLNNLPKGIYVVNGTKIAINK